MIKVSAVNQENEVVVHVESNKVEDTDELDLVYQSLMLGAPRKGGYVSSLAFQIAVQKKRED